MVFFKILLIILVSAPVIAAAWLFYGQVIGYINAKNRQEKKRRNE